MQSLRPTLVAMGIAILLVLGRAAKLASAGSAIFVSPQGNDAWSGRRAVPTEDRSDGPLASFEKAAQRSREQPAGQPRRIVFQQGKYFLEQPADLGPEDSGLTIEAAEGALVALYGGQQVTGWHRDGESLWAVDLVRSQGWGLATETNINQEHTP